MAELRRKRFILTLTVFFLVCAACFFIYVSDLSKDVFFSALFSILGNIIHISVAAMWCLSLKRRICDPLICGLLKCSGILAVLWLTADMCGRELGMILSQAEADRMLGLFFVPAVLLPLLCIFSITTSEKKCDASRSPKIIWAAAAVAAVLAVLAATSGAHHLLFENAYIGADFGTAEKIGPLGYVIPLWCVGAEMCFAAVMLIKSAKSQSSVPRRIVPALLVCGTVFCVCRYFGVIKCSPVAAHCIFALLLLESAVQGGMIGSTLGYEQLFRVSAVSAQIVDDEYRVRYFSGARFEIPVTEMKEAVISPLIHGDIRLCGEKIDGGYVVWQEDISRINRYMEALEDTGEQLDENNELLEAEFDVREKKARAEEKTRIYDRIAHEVDPQLSKVDLLVSQCEKNPDRAEELLFMVCVISAYIKRRGNLLLLGEEREAIFAKEMEYCIRESLDNLRLGGVFTSLDSRCEGTVSTENAVEIYDLFQHIIEELMLYVTAVLVHLTGIDGNVTLKMQVGCSLGINRDFLKNIKHGQGQLHADFQEEDIIITYTLPKGGEQK